jgi:integrase
VFGVSEKRLQYQAEKTNKGTRRTPSTVNRYIAVFSKSITVAIKEWEWLDENPILKIQKPPENPGRTRFLSPDEKARLLEACKASKSPFLFPIVAMALLTGMRSGEILNLRWKDVQFNEKTIMLERTKNGDHRVIPLTSHVADILKNSPNYPGAPDEFIFKNPKTHAPISIRKAFTTALRMSGIKNFRFHDLRHTAASYLAMNGATQGELMAILGHRSPQMTCRYTHFLTSHLNNLMEKALAL